MRSSSLEEKRNIRVSIAPRESSVLQDEEELGAKTPNEWDRYRSPDRSEWWKREIKPTPRPGAYEVRNFLEEIELNPVKSTYSFKSDGRRREPGVVAKGEQLLPGAYEHPDFADLTNRLNRSYGFKSKGRGEKMLLNDGMVDKDLDLSPGLYNVETYQSIDGAVYPCRGYFFKSKTRRLPSKEFVGKEGPDPGLYDVKLSWEKPAAPAMRSTAPRFKLPHNKIPGPGTYDKFTIQPGKSQVLARLAKQHGLFFTTAFY